MTVCLVKGDFLCHKFWKSFKGLKTTNRSMDLFYGARAPTGPGSHYQGFTITLRHTALGRTTLDE